MFVDQGLILPLFPGCNKDESILGKVDIDYVDIKDAAFLSITFAIKIIIHAENHYCPV